MASYEFDKPWPKGIIKREIRIFDRLADGPRQRTTVQVSPPDMRVDLGEFAEGDKIRLQIFSFHTGGTQNRDTLTVDYTIPPRPDVADDPSGRLVEWDQPVSPDAPEAGQGSGEAGAGPAPGTDASPAPPDSTIQPAEVPSDVPAPASDSTT